MIDRLHALHPTSLAVIVIVIVIVTGGTAPARFVELSAAAARVLHKPLAGELLARTLQDVLAGTPGFVAA